VSDPREQLRRYLEQRRELGEREFVLDQLSVEEALRIVGAKPEAPPPVSTDSGASDVRREESAAPDDWRAALRAAGGPSG